jgi:hypothetical protein
MLPNLLDRRALRRLCTSAVGLALLTPGLQAQTSTFAAGTVFNAPALTTFTTFGENMVGMRVTWTYDDGTFGTANWVRFGADAYGVNVGGFRVSMGRFSDTFMDAWSVINNTGRGITAVRFNGQEGRIVFDCGWTTAGCATAGDPASLAGSPNSARGWTLQTLGFGGSNIYTGGVRGVYENLVGLEGAAPVGDIFEQLTIFFTDGLATGQLYGVRADTDNTSADIPVPGTPPTAVIPEPSTYLLMLTGLGGLWMLTARGRRRTRSA